MWVNANLDTNARQDQTTRVARVTMVAEAMPADRASQFFGALTPLKRFRVEGKAHQKE
jgi:hypothetical protein